MLSASGGKIIVAEVAKYSHVYGDFRSSRGENRVLNYLFSLFHARLW